MNDSTLVSAPSRSPIAQGDHFATEGHWSRAVASWHEAAEDAPNAVSKRLSWFLAQQGPLTRRGIPMKKIVAAIAASAILATLLLLVPSEPGTIEANAMAAVSWVLIIVCTVLVVIAAQRLAPEPLEAQLRRAQRQADTMGPVTRTEERSA